jgi:hypothetical protein
MPYDVLALISVVIFALVHIFAGKLSQIGFISHSRFLSAGSGVAIAYVFIDILPKLSKSQDLVKNVLMEIFPYFERHVYVMALLGFLLFFAVDRSQKIVRNQSTYFYLSLGSYALFNFLVGYAVVDKQNPEVQPLLLFTFAIALHYFMIDYSLTKAHGAEYTCFGRWILLVCLFIGWFLGLFLTLSPTAVALVSAFIGGGVIMNVTRHELSSNNANSLEAFLLIALAYTALLLAVGA